MKTTKMKKQKGSVEVEATLLFPLAILCVVFLLYLSLLMFQKANLQASLETALVYYKSTLTDTYVVPNNELDFTSADTSTIAAGNSYSATEPLNPYRGTFGGGYDFEAHFEDYFDSIAGTMLFNDNIEVTIVHNNYLVSQQLLVTATQRVDIPLSLTLIGLDEDGYEITASAKVNVVNHDAMIRNVDYAIDLVEDTKLGKIAADFAGKIGEGYQKVKDFLGVE